MNEIVRFESGEVLVQGALDVSRSSDGVRCRRLPARARAQFSDRFMEFVAAANSGVRLVFTTDASWLELTCSFTEVQFDELTRPSVVDLVVNGTHLSRARLTGGGRLLVDSAGTREIRNGAPTTVRFDALPVGEKLVEIWLPHTAEVCITSLSSDSKLSEPPKTSAPRWIHYGSSISHCLEATGPTDVWPVIAARRAGVNVTNLGFAGNALLDQFVARAIRDAPADYISMKIGINIVAGASMRERVFISSLHGFIDTVRDGHPTTPLLLVSPIACPALESNPGPVETGDNYTIAASRTVESEGPGALTLVRVRSLMAEMVDRRGMDDPNIHYLDGLRLLPLNEAAELPDGLHPNTAMYRRMGERFAGIGFLRQS